MASDPIRITETVRFGDEFELDLRAYELRRADRPLKLERIPMDLLVLLVERRGELVTRNQIIEKIWGKDVFLDTDASINSAIRKIRQVLKDDPEQPRFVQTLSGRGYRFIAPVEEIGSALAIPAPAEGPVPLPESLLGKKVSHYRVLQLLGGGGMGVVYKAEDLKLGRMVALKFLPEERASDSVAFERLQQEARAASALDHPNICSIYQLGEHEGQPFIVMQLLEGQTLRDWIGHDANRGTAAGTGQLLDIAIQIVNGLEAAHHKGIIHRDIKPANIFITTRGEAKILDFGVAKFVDSVEPANGTSLTGSALPASQASVPTLVDPGLTRTGVSVGTPSYLSPEQVRGQKLDARTDLFSFGLVLYEMATGQRAFAGDTAVDVRHAVLNLPPVPARQLNPELAADLEGVIARALEKDRTRRYQSAAEMRTDLHRVNRVSERERPVEPREAQPARRYFWAGIVMVAIVLSILGAWKYRSRPSPSSQSRPQAVVVLADFENTTEDSVFDDALKQALSVDLEQSPSFHLLSGRRVAEMLRLMQRSASDRLTPKVAIEVCNRSTGKAMIAGSISKLGSQYLVGLTAIQCSTGDAIAHEQGEANRKEDVVEALGKVASRLRARLGESLASIQQHDVPLEQATTFSLDALRAYNLGLKTWDKQGDQAAIPFFQRATELDPNFAMAYAGLGTMYSNLGENKLGVENITKAYQLRNRLTETERFSIESRYYTHVTGELAKAAQVYQLQQQTHPDSISAHVNLGAIYISTGKLEPALAEGREAVRLDPGRASLYSNLADTCLGLNRVEEAEQAIAEAKKRGLHGESLLPIEYELAFLRDDNAAMQSIVAEASQQSGTDAMLLFVEANTQAYHGHVRKSRELTDKAVELAKGAGDREVAAEYLGEAALREAEMGERAYARRYSQQALALAPSQDAQTLAALTLARTGDAPHAQALNDDLNRRFPAHTLLQEYWLPLIQASVALDRGKASKAIEVLERPSTFDLAESSPLQQISLYPAYVRGGAYLAEGNGEVAAAQYQKFLDHRSAIGNQVLGALAHVGLGRSYALAHRIESSRTAYETFFSLWKDADPDIPILREAKTEYAKLK